MVKSSQDSDEILGGSFLNVKATAEYISKSGAENVSLVCMEMKVPLRLKRIVFTQRMISYFVILPVIISTVWNLYKGSSMAYDLLYIYTFGGGLLYRSIWLYKKL
jgi:hypothetical protein